MPVLGGWLTGEQVPAATIEQTLATMEAVLSQHGGQVARIVQPGMGLVTFADATHTMQHNDEPPVLDWVPDRRTFVYRRPLSGAHTLYYLEDWPAQGNLLFATEIKALLALGVPRQLRVAALAALLRFGFIPAPWTAFKNVSVVPAGSILRWQHAKTVVNHATDFRFEPNSQTSQQDIVEKFTTLLTENTIALLPPHTQLVALTDGSYASALPALLTSQNAQVPFTIASLSYKNDRSKVWQGVRAIAARCQRPLLTVAGVDQPEFWVAALAGLEAPCTDTRPLALHQLLHSVATETEARVALSGLGASTLFGHHQTIVSNESLNVFSSATQRKIQQEERWDDTLHARKLQRRVDHCTSEQQKQYYLALHLSLPDGRVGMMHQLAMQEGIVVRSPYLRNDVTELVTRLNDETRNTTLLTTLAERYLSILPDAQKRLSLDPPVPSLLRVAASPLLQQTLSPEAIQATGLFDVENVAQLLKQKTATKALLLVFTTQLFCRLFDVEVE